MNNTNLKTWIGYYEDIVSKDECESLIRDVKKSGQLKPSTYSNHTGEIKRSDNRVIMDDMWVKDKKTSSIINDFFGKVIRKYSDKFERFSCQRHSGFRVNRYSSGGFMSEHTDNIHHSHGQQYGFPQVSALLFLNDNTLLISSGDGFNHREKAQELDNHFGKILRVNDDGSIPSDNPIFKEDNALKDIFTYGHRNQQGLAKDINGIIYSHEHGPKGGDELNIIYPGLNYGWPAITYGIDYNGSIISPFKKKEGMEQPIKYWTPSIALSDMTFYYSDIFPEWYGNLFISALSPGDVRRLVIKDNMIVSEEIMFKEINSRIRSIKSSKNGNLIILTDGRGKKNSGKIIKVSPNN